MRIADHAPVLQGSPVLQQPSNAVHLQQVLAAEMARAAAAAEAQQHASTVQDANRAEGRAIQNRSPHSGGKKAGQQTPGKQPEKDKDHQDPMPRGKQPGSGDLVDITA